MTPRLIHCSYHKCLTMYYHRVMAWLYNRILPWGCGYRHFDSRIDAFYDNAQNYRVASINNRALDPGRLGDFRLTRFVRDPRDMVVSGYFYHLRGAENWCNLTQTDTLDWGAMNGNPPAGMKPGQSFSAYLQSLNQEEGLIAEIEFRRHHLDSMIAWPTADRRIKVFRYEDVLGRETQVFAEIMRFYEVPWFERQIAVALAKRFSASGSRRLKSHIRNPKAGQWQEYFTPRVSDYFYRHHNEVVKRYGYD